MPDRFEGVRVAVLIPCHNEETTVTSVVRDFKMALPSANVYVYDNASTDRTSELAIAAGATVGREPRPGKGNVVRRMFADIEADVYVLVDGDDTYHAASAEVLVAKLLSDRLDMVNGARESEIQEAYRFGHRFGNWLLTNMVSTIFGRDFDDMLSGYRVFSRRFVKSFPALSSGFEIETELTVHALEQRMPVTEVRTPYKERPEGSVSKLRTIHDGVRIVRTIMKLVKEERPLTFFGSAALALVILAIGLAVPIIMTYLDTGLVPRIPTAVLCASLIILACLSMVCGLILDTVTRGRQEVKRMQYLSIALDTPATLTTSSRG